MEWHQKVFFSCVRSLAFSCVFVVFYRFQSSNLLTPLPLRKKFALCVALFFLPSVFLYHSFSPCAVCFIEISIQCSYSVYELKILRVSGSLLNIVLFSSLFDGLLKCFFSVWFMRKHMAHTLSINEIDTYETLHFLCGKWMFSIPSVPQKLGTARETC